MKRPKDVQRPSDAPADKRKTGGVPFAHGSSDRAVSKGIPSGDGPRLPHAASHDDAPGSPGPDSSVTTRLRALRTRAEPATPVEAAAALIELSVHESNGPVEDLSGALARMAQLVQSPPGNSAGTADKPLDRAQLARDVAICIESLQFHDRLTQQLTQIRNLLATLASNDLSADLAGQSVEGDRAGSEEIPSAGDPQKWLVLLENVRARFTSDSHRILFNLLLPGAGGRSNVPALHANEGSVELF